MPWLARLLTGLLPWRPVLETRAVRMGFVVDPVTLRRVSSRIRVFPLSIVPLMLHTRTKFTHRPYGVLAIDVIKTHLSAVKAEIFLTS